MLGGRDTEKRASSPRRGGRDDHRPLWPPPEFRPCAHRRLRAWRPLGNWPRPEFCAAGPGPQAAGLGARSPFTEAPRQGRGEGEDRGAGAWPVTSPEGTLMALVRSHTGASARAELLPLRD